MSPTVPLHLVCDLPKAFANWRHIHVRDPLNLVVIHFGRCPDVLDLYNGIQGCGLLEVGSADRNICEIGKVVNRCAAILEILNREEIVVAALPVDPIVGSNHRIRIERGDNVIDHLLLG